MTKKTLIITTVAVLIAIAAGAWATTTAFADEGGFGDRLRIARRGLGQIISIEENQFSVQRRDGETYIVMIDDETEFRGKDREEMSFADLKVDGWVVIIPDRLASSEGGDILARTVFILPEGFDPTLFGGARGLIASVDIAANQFSLETENGEELTFDVDAETRFLGAIESLEDLELEMQAVVRSQEQEDGSLLALGVLSPPLDRGSLQRKLGQVQDIDIDNGTFSLQTRGAEDFLTIQVDENTRFRSRDQVVQGLDDLEPEMIVAVVVRQQDDDALLALMVGGAGRDQLPRFEARTAGLITAIEDNSFTIRARNGETYQILVTGVTRFRGQNGQVESVDDLQVDMRVIVAGKELGEGRYQYQAQVVFVLPIFR